MKAEAGLFSLKYDPGLISAESRAEVLVSFASGLSPGSFFRNYPVLIYAVFILIFFIFWGFFICGISLF